MYLYLILLLFSSAETPMLPILTNLLHLQKQWFQNMEVCQTWTRKLVKGTVATSASENILDSDRKVVFEDFKKLGKILPHFI